MSVHQIRAFDVRKNRFLSPDELARRPYGQLLNDDNLLLSHSIGVHSKQDRRELYEGDYVAAMSQGVRARFEIVFRKTSGAPTYILYPAFQGGQSWSIHVKQHDGKLVDDLEYLGNKFEHPTFLD